MAQPQATRRPYLEDPPPPGVEPAKTVMEPLYPNVGVEAPLRPGRYRMGWRPLVAGLVVLGILLAFLSFFGS